MEEEDKNEIIIAVVVLFLFIAFIFARKVCTLVPLSCNTGWIVFGILFISAVVFLKVKVFK